MSAFEVICEIDPPASPDPARLHEQLDVLAPVASRFLVPDNHTGRASVSSVVLASDVQRRGGRAIACLNARDRNLLAVRRDLLTARYSGVDELLLVYGDDAEVGERAGAMTVRTMLAECRGAGLSLRAAVTTRLGPVPDWKQDADALFVQVTYSIDDLLRWRETVRFDGPIYTGVLVLPSARMATRLGERIPELRVPQPWIDALSCDAGAGVELACRHVDQIRMSGAFDGVHLVCGTRHRETAAMLTDAWCGTMRR